MSDPAAPGVHEADPAVATADGDATVADLAGGFVASVCRPQDVDRVLAMIERVDPVDLGALVAAVDEHQPMTLEVVVDVLAELQVPPTAIAGAVGIDPEDVRVLLGTPLGAPPPSSRDRDARIIEVVSGTAATTRRDDVADHARPDEQDPGDAEPDDREGPLASSDDGDRPEVAPRAEPDETPREEPGAARDEEPDEAPDGAPDGAPDEAPGQTPERAPGDGTRAAPGSDGGPPIVRIDEVADGDRADRVAADLQTVAEADVSRGRLLWAVLLFVLLAGGAVGVAWLLGAF